MTVETRVDKATSSSPLTIIPFYISDLRYDHDVDANTPEISITSSVKVESVIKIAGKGFSTTASDNLVSFVGALDPISTAVPTDYAPGMTTDVGDTLTVEIPTDARTGPITVTTAFASVSSESVMIDENSNNEPEFPSTIATYTYEVPENSVASTSLTVTSGTPTEIIASDSDADDILAFTLLGDGADLFKLADGSTDRSKVIQVADGAILDYEVTDSYMITVQVVDGYNLDERDVSIQITDVDDAPMFTDTEGALTSSYTFGLDENTAGSTIVGTIDVTDQDGEAMFYSIVLPAMGALSLADITDNFELVPIAAGVQIRVRAGATLDFEGTNNVYEFNIVATEAAGEGIQLTATATVTINIIDVNEKPIFAAGTGDSPFIVDENTSGIVGTVSATDPDDGDVITYSMTFLDGTSADAVFEILDEAKGEISVTAGATLDFEIREEYELTIKAEDVDGLDATVAVTISLNNLNDSSPVFVDASTGSEATATTYSFTHREDVNDTRVGTIVGTVSATDADADGILPPLEYSL